MFSGETLNMREDERISAVTAEQNRRGKKLPVPEPKHRVEGVPSSSSRGQIDAVRAAFKADITPSRIARRFGLSQSNVRKALKSGDP
jgi:DNA-binding transcriptional ArsR family regulator